MCTVCVHVWMYVHVHMYVLFTCVCACMWSPTVDIRYLPISLFTIYFEAKFLPESGAQVDKSSWLVNPGGSLFLYLPHGAFRCCPHTQLLLWYQGSKLTLPSKHFTHGATLPAPTLDYVLICHTKEMKKKKEQASWFEFLLNILQLHYQETSAIHALSVKFPPI